MKYISLIFWDIPRDLLNGVLKTSDLSMSPVKAARSQSKVKRKRCRRTSKDAGKAEQPSLQPRCLPSVTACAGSRGRGVVEEEGEACTTIACSHHPKGSIFRPLPTFPTHADTHTSLIQRGFVSYHLRNHYQNTDTICFRVVCGSPVMANAQTQKQPWPSCPTGDKVQCSQLIFL